MALEDQMEMNFGRGQVDPVSGNEVPTGSLPEEVRDDIPAQLSEGEYVVPADVVRYWGVKLFEDLRMQAKIGFEQMDEDGRIGGEPMDMELGDMGLEMSDLEVAEMPDDMPDGMPEEAFLGKFFSGLRASNKKAAQKIARDRFEAAKKRQSVKNIKAGTNKKPKFKNRAEEMLYNLRNRGSSSSRDDRRVTLTEKPATSDTTRSSGTIAEQINFGGDYDDKPKKKAPPKKVKPGGRATPFVDDAPEKEGVNLRSTESFKTKFMRGLGVEGYDDGGDVNPTYEQKGGFDMTDAKPIEGIAAGEVTEGMTMEARIYVNDAGHEITIMFANGVPLTPIPAGYYPKAETVTPETGVQTGGGGGGGSQLPEPPKPINYQELSIDEITKEVKDLQTPPPIPGILGALFKGAQERHRAKTMEEIDRRLASEDLAIYEKEYLQNLKEVLEAPQGKGVIGKFIDNITGQVVEEPDLPNLTGPKYDMLPDQYGVTEPYTPEAQTPTVSEQGVDASDFKQMQDNIEINRIEQEMRSNARGGSSGSTYDEVPQVAPVADPDPEPDAKTKTDRGFTPTNTAPPVRGNTIQEKDSQRRRNRQQANKNMAGSSTRRKTRQSQSATRGLSSKEKKGGAGLDSRFGITGLKDGGLASKKEVKEVVKGLKKASKLHAKQAETLEKKVLKKDK